MMLSILVMLVLSMMSGISVQVEAERNLENEFKTQPPLGCVENEDGSATCLDEEGGWHFEVSPWRS